MDTTHIFYVLYIRIMASSGRQQVPIAGVELDSDDDDASNSDVESWGSTQHVSLTTATKRVEVGATVTNPMSAATKPLEAIPRPAPRRPSPDHTFGNLDYKRTQDGSSVVQPLYVEAVPYFGSTKSSGSESQPTSTSSSVSPTSQSSGKKTPSETVSKRTRPVEESQKIERDLYRITFIEKIALVAFIGVVAIAIGTTCGITGCRVRKKAGTLQTVKSRGALRCGVTDFELTDGQESVGLSKTMVSPFCFHVARILTRSP